MSVRIRLAPALIVCAVLACVAATAASAPAAVPSTPTGCDVTGDWSGTFTGTRPLDNGSVDFEITNQQPSGNDNLQGDNNSQGNETYTFQFQTLDVVPGGASASGTGSLTLTSPTSAQFSISGQGMHPMYGAFTIQAQGMVDCAAGTGAAATGNYTLQFADGTSDQGTTDLAHAAPCPGPGIGLKCGL